MLKFFRQIRKQNLTKNRISKYLFYAVGEIVLVVVGILIALQINNWNQQREEKQAVRRYLSGLIEDLTDDLAQYNRRGDHAAFKFHSAQHLLLLAGETPVKLHAGEFVKPLTNNNILWNKSLPDQVDRNFMATAFLWTVRDVYPVISRSTINEMTAAGSFSYLSNKPLKDAITDYYNELEWRFSQIGKAKTAETIQEWQWSLAKSGVLVQDISGIENPLSLITNNSERIGHLRILIRGAWFRAESLDLMQKNAQDLIQMIEVELKE